MSRRSRRRAPDEEELHPDERWAVSYLDFITVMFITFVVFFAMSSIDAAKFEQLRNSLATGFGQVEDGKIDTASGVIVPEEHVDSEGEPTDLDLAQIELDELEAIEAAIRAGLREEGMADTVRFQIDDRGLAIRLVSTETFFSANDSALTRRAKAVLDVVGPIIAKSPYEVSVEGHADYRRPVGYPTNWELSSARSTRVVRHLIGEGGIKAAKISAVGFGSAQPLRDGKDSSSLSMNRRVDIMVLSDESESVRSLLPGLVDAGP